MTQLESKTWLYISMFFLALVTLQAGFIYGYYEGGGQCPVPMLVQADGEIIG